MTKTVLGVFSSEQAAEKAVTALRDKGFSTNEINILQKGNQGSKGSSSSSKTGHGSTSMSSKDTDGMGSSTSTDSISDGVASGATWGGLAGLALGAGALAVPGVGPLLAAGPIAAALTGAATGGLAGGLIDWGVPESAGRNYEDQVRQGGVLAVIRVSEQKADEAAKILRENGAKDVGMHSTTK